MVVSGEASSALPLHRRAQLRDVAGLRGSLGPSNGNSDDVDGSYNKKEK